MTAVDGAIEEIAKKVFESKKDEVIYGSKLAVIEVMEELFGPISDQQKRQILNNGIPKDVNSEETKGTNTEETKNKDDQCLKNPSPKNTSNKKSKKRHHFPVFSMSKVNNTKSASYKGYVNSELGKILKAKKVHHVFPQIDKENNVILFKNVEVTEDTASKHLAKLSFNGPSKTQKKKLNTYSIKLGEFVIDNGLEEYAGYKFFVVTYPNGDFKIDLNNTVE